MFLSKHAVLQCSNLIDCSHCSHCYYLCICIWLCDEALLNFSHHATVLSIFKGEWQTEQRYVWAIVFRSIETTEFNRIHHHLQISWNFHFWTQLWFSLALKHARPWISVFWFLIFDFILFFFWNRSMYCFYFHTSYLIFGEFFHPCHVSLLVVGCKGSLSYQLCQIWNIH